MSLDLERLLRIFCWDDTDYLWWRGKDSATEGPLQFFVNCNDVFAWGCADVEQIESDEDLDALDQAKADAPNDWPFLWVARKRGMRPQGAAYKHFDKESIPLFNACGPWREPGLGNPHDVPHEEGCLGNHKGDCAVSGLFS